MKSFFTPVSGGAPPAASTDRRAPQGAPKAIVIGSGFGGLAAAIRLSCRGYHVEVFEKLDGPGGRAYVWKQDGFTFDAGPTIVTAPFMLEELWALCGRKFADDIDLRPMDPYYRIRFDDGSWFDYSGDEAHMRREVARFSPDDLPGYENFLKEAATCYKLGFEELGAKAFDGIGDLLAAVPSLTKMRGWRSIYRMVAGHLRNPKLRIVMSFHPLLIGGNPFSVTCVYSLINTLERRFGVHWAMGGTGALIRGMVGLLAERGVAVRCNAEVRRITVDKGRATGIELADGSLHRADIVVSNADTAWTYRHLVEPQHRRHWTDQRIERGRYSMSLFVWYFGTKKRFDDVPHHMMVLGPRYEGLLTDIFKRQHLAEDFSLYLHRPTATDPSMAPEGCDAFYVLSPVPHLGSGTDWAARAETYRRAIEARLEATVLPGLREQIVTSRVTTPQDFHDRLLSFKGAAFGLEPLLLQSAWFRPHNRSEDVQGLFMVGASTHPGAGVPGVLMSAKALETVVPHVSSLA
ncbi:phytoene desaturase [Rhizobacter sp. AJA081-3]|uniref:phytoene desaturase n=1 Tax=Rhizobacter sp. AJA081-3 TaxID=2753607 RepID=UPI001AE0A3D9|nr:phytoene desaturase [Rhizobacter sp. AJA081-3]QTN24663.1 phytoene desaturase [Rhizobacter sp. AJA081-3]